MRQRNLILVATLVVSAIISLVVMRQLTNADRGEIGVDDHEPTVASLAISKDQVAGSESRMSGDISRRRTTGLVMNVDGSAVERAEIVAFCRRNSFVATGGADGHFVVDCPCDGDQSYCISASAPGYMTETITVLCDETAPVKIVLKAMPIQTGFALRVQFIGRSAQDLASVRYYFGIKGALSDPLRGRELHRGAVQVEHPSDTATIAGIPYGEIDIALLCAGFVPEKLVDLKLTGSSIERPAVVRVSLDGGGAAFGDIDLDGVGDRIKRVFVGVWPKETIPVFPDLDGKWNSQSTFLSTRIKAQKALIDDVEIDSRFHVPGIPPGKYHLAALGDDGFPISEIVTIDINNDLAGPYRLKILRGRALQMAFTFEGVPLRIVATISGGPRKQVALGRPDDRGYITIQNVPHGKYFLEPMFSDTITPGSQSYPNSLLVRTAEVFAAVWSLAHDELWLTVSEGHYSHAFDVGSGLLSYERWSLGEGVAIVRAIENAIANDHDTASTVAEFGKVDKKLVNVAVAFANLRKMLVATREPPTPRMAAIAGLVSAGSIRSVLRAFVTPD